MVALDQTRSKALRGAALGATALAALAVAGCETLPGAGPIMSRASGETSLDAYGFSMVELNTGSVAAYSIPPKVDFAGLSARGPGRVSLQSGDVLRISIAESKEGGLFAPLASGGTSFPAVRVDHDGQISLPYVGQFPVRGLDNAGVEASIRERLKGTAFEPQVYVELASDRSNNVLVAGEVKAPGRVSLLEGPTSLVDVINRAGGAMRPPLHTDVVLRRGRQASRMSLAEVLAGRNVSVARGDEVVLEYAPRTFNAMGAVLRTGQHEFRELSPSLLQVLSQVGGLSDQAANRSGVFVFRLNEPRARLNGGSKWERGSVVFRLDMAQPDAIFSAQRFLVRPGDTVYITNAPLYEWGKLIRPIIQGMSVVGSADNVVTGL
jgi:polysaccharide export outer membrane protein